MRYLKIFLIILTGLIIILLFNNNVHIYTKEKAIPIYKIEGLFNVAWKTDREIIENLNFQVALDQPLKGFGDSEKYILIDDLNDKWLFKHAKIVSRSNLEEAVSKLGVLCGLNFVYVHKVALPINGNIVIGTIQRFMPDVLPIGDISIIRGMTYKQKNEILRQQILDYFVGNFDSNLSDTLYSSENLKIYSVDKDGSCGFNDRNIVDFSDYIDRGNIYNVFWDEYSKNNLDIMESTSLIYFIKEISFNLLHEIFDFVDINCNIKPYSNLPDYLENRRNNLPETFNNFYKRMLKNQNLSIKISYDKDLNNYKKYVLNKLNDDILEKRKILKFLKNKSEKTQSTLNIISSPKIRFLIYDLEDFVDVIKNKDFEYKIEKFKEMWEDLAKIINKYRNKSPDIHEYLALSLYILEIGQRYEKCLEKNHGCFFKPELILISPESEQELNTWNHKFDKYSNFNISIIDWNSEIKNLKQIITLILQNRRKIIQQ